MIREFDPDVVFWLSNRDRFPILQDGEVLMPGTPQWEEAAFADWDATLARLTARGAHVVLVLPYYRAGDDPTECSGPDAQSAECTRPILSIGSLRSTYERWAAGHVESVTVFNPDVVVCPAAPCPAEVDGVVLRSDPVHFTEEGAKLMARELVRRLPSRVWRPDR